MPGQTLNTDAIVLLKRAPADAFQTFTVFSPSQGALLASQRLSKKSASSVLTLDLFDEVALLLESSNQGQTWFVKESRLVARHTGLGRDYETLSAASALATLVARNPTHEESREKIYALLQQALAAFAENARPDIVYLKSLYRFARDEGYPLREQWFPTLAAADRHSVATLLNQPLASQTAPAPTVARLQRRLEDYLRGHTEILL